jgi:hypothetical protein
MAKVYKHLRRQRTERRLKNQSFMEPSKRLSAWPSAAAERQRRTINPLAKHSLILHLEPVGRRAGAVGRPVSAPRCAGRKRVIRIAGIHKIGTRGAQQFFDLLDRLPNQRQR